jgi:hypothetical protein
VPIIKKAVPVRVLEEWLSMLWDDRKQIPKAARFIQVILAAGSARLSEVARQLGGKEQSNYKALHRFLGQSQPARALLRLYREEAPFILADPTEIERPQAKKTSYVGKLKDGKTPGFWLLVLATPYRGRAIPLFFLVYSSATLEREVRSRNWEHRRALEEVKGLLAGKPLVFDREFSYLEFLGVLVVEGLSFVIRLNTGLAPTQVDGDGEKVVLEVKPGRKAFYRNLCYLGKVKVNVAEEWRPGLSQPLWVVTNMEPKEGLALYQQRMRVDESFRELKSLLGLGQVMNKRQEYLEKVIALVLLAYGLGLLLGGRYETGSMGEGGGGSCSPACLCC